MSSIIPRAPFAQNDIATQATHDIQTTTTGGVLRHVDIAEDTARSLVERKRTWLSRVWPDEIDRAKAEAEVRLAKTELQAIEKTLYLVRAAATQALEESLNSVLLKGQAQVRRDTLSFITGQKVAFIQEIQDLSVKAARAIARFAAEAESVPYGPAREMIEIQAQEQVILYKQWTDSALEKFKSIINEQVKFPGDREPS